MEKAIDGQKSQITVLAISTSGDMYFIEGTRKYKGSLPTFAATGLPIRTGVGFLSPQYISSLGAPEVIYVETSNGQLRHLIRDPKSTLWAEQGVYVAGKEGNVTSFVSHSRIFHLSLHLPRSSSLNVFECLVSLKGSLGSSVGTNFVVVGLVLISE